MAVKLWEATTTNAFQTTLDGTIDDSVVTISLTSTTGLVAPGVLVLDRQDGNGSNTPTKREYVTFTAISSNDVTGVTRGVAGSTAAAHSSGALVEATPTVTHWGDMVDFMQVEHSAAGLHVISTATVNYTETKRLAVTSLASIAVAKIGTHLSVSGASVSGIGLHPTWILPGNASAATTAIGKPIAMPQLGQFQSFSATLRSPISGASLILDVNKNFSSIFEAGTRPTILGGGTFVSTASINTKNFIAGDVFSVDLDAGGNYSDISLVGRAA